MNEQNSRIITARWYEAVASPTYARWHSLAQMLSVMADQAETQAPDAPDTLKLQRMYRDAYAEVLSLQPKERESA